MSTGAAPDRGPHMDPVVAVLLRRFELQLRQLDPEIDVESGPLRRVYRLGEEVLAVVYYHRDLFRLQTGGVPTWEARIREPDEALAALARVFDRYWQLLARTERKAL